MEYLLIDDSEESGSEGSAGNRSLAKVLRSTESNILGASRELKDIVIESGHMAESLFERVNDGYTELTVRYNLYFSILRYAITFVGLFIDAVNHSRCHCHSHCGSPRPLLK